MKDKEYLTINEILEDWTMEEIEAINRKRIRRSEYGIKYFNFNSETTPYTKERAAKLHKLQEILQEELNLIKLQKRAKEESPLVKASCGHSVAKSDLMSTSTGSSCQDCYDRMSE